MATAGSMGGMDPDVARALLRDAAAEHQQAAAEAAAAEERLRDVIAQVTRRTALPAAPLPQTEVARATGYTREHIRRVALAADRAAGRR